MPILPQHNLCRHLQSQSQDFKSSTGVVPAPVMEFSLPRAHKPCSFTSRGLIFPPYSKEADKELPLPSTEAQTHMHLSLQGQAHLPGRKKKSWKLPGKHSWSGTWPHISEVRQTDREITAFAAWLPVQHHANRSITGLVIVAQNVLMPVLSQETLWEGIEQPQGSLNNWLSVCCPGKKGISNSEQCQALLLQEK